MGLHSRSILQARQKTSWTTQRKLTLAPNATTMLLTNSETRGTGLTIIEHWKKKNASFNRRCRQYVCVYVKPTPSTVWPKQTLTADPESAVPNTREGNDLPTAPAIHSHLRPKQQMATPFFLTQSLWRCVKKNFNKEGEAGCLSGSDCLDRAVLHVKLV